MSRKQETLEDLMQNWVKQLRKGTLELAILSFIENNSEKTYGYHLINNLKEGGIDTDGNTIYPILRRLEKKKLIESTWSTLDNQPKKMFKITEIGSKVLNELRDEWNDYNEKVNHFIKKEV